MGNVPTINALPTTYKGIEFRSKNEAQWAVFLDECGIEWQYEPAGYQLISGWYLPDFWLPEVDAFLEVKPSGTPEDIRWSDLVAMTGKSLFVTDGSPGYSHPTYGQTDDMPSVAVTCYRPIPACDHSLTVRVRKPHSSGYHVCEQCAWCGDKVVPNDGGWLKRQPGDDEIDEWRDFPEMPADRKRIAAYGQNGGYYDAPYFFCQCQTCGKWGCEFDGRSARIPCKCSKPSDKEYTAHLTMHAVETARTFRFWNPGGAS